MFILSINGAEVARAASPFAFDPTARLWVSDSHRVYDLELAGTQADDKNTGLPFQAQSAPAPKILPRHVTVLGFRNRFKPAEKVALEIASLDNPAAGMPARQQAASLRAFIKDVESATFIDLARPDTREGVQYLEIAGLLTEGRALEILDAEITDLERFKG